MMMNIARLGVSIACVQSFGDRVQIYGVNIL